MSAAYLFAANADGAHWEVRVLLKLVGLTDSLGGWIASAKDLSSAADRFDLHSGANDQCYVEGVGLAVAGDRQIQHAAGRLIWSEVI